MIYSISANMSSFRKVIFKPGFNVILADASSDSEEKDSRNGTGKTSILRIIHFCFGAEFKGSGLDVEDLNGWEFTVDVDIDKARVKITRGVDTERKIFVDGNIASLSMQPNIDKVTGLKYFPLDDWKKILLQKCFPVAGEMEKDHGPSFRMLFSYFARKGKYAYISPFDYFKNQPGWQRQVTNTFLLGLSWENAREWQILKRKEDALAKIKNIANAGELDDLLGSVGELESKKVSLKSKIATFKKHLDEFKVLPQYKEIEKEGNDLTGKIHQLSNETIINKKILENYDATTESDENSDVDEVKNLYAKAGAVFLPESLRHLDDVVEFHNQLLKNRSLFLNQEIDNLKKKIQAIEEEKSRLIEIRAEKLSLLKTHGALEERDKLQAQHLDKISELNDILKRLENLKKLQSGRSALRIEKETLRQKTITEYDERESIWEIAIASFNEASEYLYNSPGRFIIDIGDSGFVFKVDIERAGSDGIQQMEIFCYDMALVKIWSQKDKNLGFMIHDSSLFADVDERQVAKALEYAKKQCEENGYQYICCLNTDNVPFDKFSKNFKLNNYERITLRDKPVSQCLFGKRF